MMSLVTGISEMANEQKDENVITEESKMNFNSQKKQSSECCQTNFEDDAEDEDEADAINQANMNNIFPVAQLAIGCHVVSDLVLSTAQTIGENFVKVINDEEITTWEEPKEHEKTTWEAACEGIFLV